MRICKIFSDLDQELKNQYPLISGANCKRSGFVHQELRESVKMTLTGVSSH